MNEEDTVMLKKNLFLLAIVLLVSETTLTLAREGRDMINGSIAFDKGNDGAANIYVVDAKVNQQRRLTSEGNNVEPRWSPDATRIAFTSLRRGHEAEIYIMDSDGNNQKRLTFTKNGFSTFPRWSGNGKKIYFTSNIKGNFEENIIDLYSLETKTLYTMDKSLGIREVFQVIESPNGRYQLFHYNSGKIVLLDQVSKDRVSLALSGDKPGWSKDSRKFAYFVGELPRNTLAVFNAEKKQYLEKLKISNSNLEDCFSPSWNSNSNRIVYVRGPLATEKELWLYIYDFETKQFERLVRGSHPDWH
jgi:Tol biopolymer transport system component